MRFVLGVNIVAKRFRGLVEDNRNVGRLVVRGHLLEQLVQHVAKALHGTDRQPVGLAGQRRQCVIGAEYIAGAIDQIEMVTGLDRAGCCCAHGARTMPLALRLCHKLKCLFAQGWHCLLTFPDMMPFLAGYAVAQGWFHIICRSGWLNVLAKPPPDGWIMRLIH